MASLRELEFLKTTIDNQQKEINELKEIVNKLQENINSKNSNNNFKNDKLSDNNLSIIFTRYKHSVLLKNKYTDKNTSIKCKNQLKELGAKWFKNDSTQGWLFVGIYKNEENSIEEICEFIIEKLKENNFNLEIEYE